MKATVYFCEEGKVALALIEKLAKEMRPGAIIQLSKEEMDVLRGDFFVARELDFADAPAHLECPLGCMFDPHGGRWIYHVYHCDELHLHGDGSTAWPPPPIVVEKPQEQA